VRIRNEKFSISSCMGCTVATDKPQVLIHFSMKNEYMKSIKAGFTLKKDTGSS
jgi:hypothetical protein